MTPFCFEKLRMGMCGWLGVCMLLDIIDALLAVVVGIVLLPNNDFDGIMRRCQSSSLGW